MKLMWRLMLVTCALTTPLPASAQSADTAVVASALRELIRAGHIPADFAVSPYALLADADGHGSKIAPERHSQHLPSDLALKLPCRLTTGRYCDLIEPGETSITYSAPQVGQGRATVTFLVGRRLTTGKLDSVLLEVDLVQRRGWEVQDIRHLWHGQSK